MLDLERYSDSYTSWTVSRVKPCFKILVSAPRGKDEFLQQQVVHIFDGMVPSFSSLMGIRKEDFQILTSKKSI